MQAITPSPVSYTHLTLPTNNRHKAGNAFAADRRKKRVYKLDRLLITDRKAQKYSAPEYHPEKSDNNRLHRIELQSPRTLFFLFHF